MLYEVLTVVATLVVVVVTYFKWKYKYWERKGVPYIQPTMPFGNAQNPFGQRVPTYMMFKGRHEYFKSMGHKHGGFYVFAGYSYLPVDLELIRNIMSKDFGHFTDRGVYVDEKNDPLTAHLFALEGQKWRNMRTKLTPTFTSAKMKMMFQTMLDCGEQLKDYVETAEGPLDIKEILASFTTDVIGSCAFGVDCNSFKDPDSEFRSNGRKIFTPSLRRKFRILFLFTVPSLGKRLGLKMFDESVVDFFMNAVKTMVRHREENDVKRNDFLQLLIELKQGENGLNVEQMAAQAFVFFLAGFETSSTTMNFCLFELTQNLEVQEKVRRELLDVLERHDGKLSYDCIMQLKYMGQVIDETLRKYPPVPALSRRCVKDYEVPGTDVVIDKGTMTFVSVMAIHYDPEFYPDPEKFDPERFTEENKAKRHPYAFLPFGEGPRNCIGLRFGLMQTRVGLALILRNFRLTLSPKTELPLRLDPNAFLLTTRNKIWLDAEKIK